MNQTKTWEQWEAGREYKRRIGLYENVWRNESFYRGEQWEEGRRNPLPRPVFNIIHRIVDYLVCTVGGENLTITYADDALVGGDDSAKRPAVAASLELLNRHVAYRWEHCRMDRMVYRLLLDAALSGDGVAYCYWNPAMPGDGRFGGDICTTTWNNTELHVADMNKPDIQSQEYVILSGRETVGALRREARSYGLDPKEAEKIHPDGWREDPVHARTPELEEAEQAKVTVLLKFWKEDGAVWFEKSTRDVVLRRVRTELRLYPVAYFNWIPTRGSFHGTSPVSSLIPNQKFINRAYAMVMKHMTDTAFSKVVYDKNRIPEWNNEVGEAIAAMGGNLSDAVQVVGVGQMENGYMELINSAISVTKELMGATDTALGTEQAKNTSAILALQEASRTSLRQVTASFLQGMEDLACIWADMLCAYGNRERFWPMIRGGEKIGGRLDPEILRMGTLVAKVEIGSGNKYSASGTQNTLDRLLDGGFITLRQYLELLPPGILPSRSRLLDDLKQKEDKDAERNGEEGGDGSGAGEKQPGGIAGQSSESRSGS